MDQSYLIDLFERAVQNFPSSIALTLEDGRQISYAELNDKASILEEIIFQIISNQQVI
jgi:non-ribosomal peptide synthetase component F